MSPKTDYEGKVSAQQQRWELNPTGQELVWDFRIERFDPAGKPLPRVPVQMRGKGFDGAIKEGDLVRVQGDWAPGQTLHVGELLNLTTGARVCAFNVYPVFGAADVPAKPAKGSRRRKILLVLLAASLAFGLYLFMLALG